MAFNPNYYNNYYGGNNSYMPQAPAQNVQTLQPQIQNNGFVMVRSEAEARNFPVALGNSVTFKDETAPYIYSKTMGFSQLDRPIFEKYKLVKEEIKETLPGGNEDIKDELKRIWAEINLLKGANNEQSAKYNSNVKSIETGSNEDAEYAV